MSVICQSFMQNAWRKDLCSNCFRLQADHQNPAASLTDGQDAISKLASSAVANGRYVPQATPVYQNRGLICPHSWKSLIKDQKDWMAKATIPSLQVSKIETVKKTKDPNGILKTSTDRKKKANVVFADKDPQVIGYGGIDYLSDDPDWTPNEITSDDEDINLESFDVTEADRTITKLTKLNTEFNSDNKNLLSQPETKVPCKDVLETSSDAISAKISNDEPEPQNGVKIIETVIKENLIYSSSDNLCNEKTSSPSLVKTDEMQQSLINGSNVKNETSKISEEKSKPEEINSPVQPHLQKLSNGYGSLNKEPEVQGPSRRPETVLTFDTFKAPKPTIPEPPAEINNDIDIPKVTWSKLAESSKKRLQNDEPTKPEILPESSILKKTESTTTLQANNTSSSPVIEESKVDSKAKEDAPIPNGNISNGELTKKEILNSPELSTTANQAPGFKRGRLENSQKPRLPTKPNLANIERHKNKMKDMQRDKSFVKEAYTSHYAVSSVIPTYEPAREIRRQDPVKKISPYAESIIVKKDDAPLPPEILELKTTNNRETKLAALALELEQVRCNGLNSKRQAPNPPREELDEDIREIKREVLPSEYAHPILVPRENLQIPPRCTVEVKTTRNSLTRPYTLSPEAPKSKKSGKFSLKKLLKRNSKDESSDMAKAWKQQTDRHRLEILHPMDLEAAKSDSGFVSLETSDSDKKSDIDSPSSSEESSTSSPETEGKSPRPPPPPRAAKAEERKLQDDVLQKAEEESGMFYENLGNVRSTIAPKKPDRGTTGEIPATAARTERPEAWFTLEHSYAVVSAANHEVLAKLLDKVTLERALEKPDLSWAKFSADSSCQMEELRVYHGLYDGMAATVVVDPGGVERGKVKFPCLGIFQTSEGQGHLLLECEVTPLEQFTPGSQRDVAFLLLQGVHVAPDSRNLLVARVRGLPYLLALAGKADGPAGSRCAFLLELLKKLGTNNGLEPVAKVLSRDRPYSLSQARSLLESLLWGPAPDLAQHDGALQRWLDTERARCVRLLVSMLSRSDPPLLTLYDEHHMLFLLRTSARSLRESSLQLAPAQVPP